MNAYIGGSSASLMMPSVQIRVPQVQFPSPINIVPQQQYLMYNLPLQSPFFGIQQPKVSTQCCVVSPVVPSIYSSILILPPCPSHFLTSYL